MNFEQLSIRHKECVNQSTATLYKRLESQQIIIDFEVVEQPTWGMQEYPAEERFKIFCSNTNLIPECLIHELQHVEMAVKGFRDELSVQAHFSSRNSFFNSRFGQQKLNELNNKIAHIKMIDEFKKMGNPASLFLNEPAQKYFLRTIKPEIDCIRNLEQAEIIKPGLRIFVFLYSIGAEKLFEQYPEPEICYAIRQALHEIDIALYTRISAIYDEWKNDTTNNNIGFYESVQNLLEEFNVLSDYSPELNVYEEAICRGNVDIFGCFDEG